MRGINRIIISGNVTADGNFHTMQDGSLVCSFGIASDRHTRGDIITAFTRVNVYIENLAKICQQRLRKGCYVLVEGELMNRSGTHEELTEIRAREILFL